MTKKKTYKAAIKLHQKKIRLKKPNCKDTMQQLKEMEVSPKYAKGDTKYQSKYKTTIIWHKVATKRRKFMLKYFFFMSTNRNQKKAARWFYSLKMTQTWNNHRNRSLAKSSTEPKRETKWMHNHKMKWETTTESHKKRTETQNDNNQNLKNRHRMDPMKKATNKY